MGRNNDRQRGAGASGRRESAGVAVSNDPRVLRDEFQTVFADGGIDLRLFGGDGVSFGEQIVGRQNAVYRPSEVDGGRTRFAHALYRERECVVVVNRVAQQRDAERAENADARRAAHRQRRNRPNDLVGCRSAHVSHFVREQPLIEVYDGIDVPGDRRKLVHTPAGTCAVKHVRQYTGRSPRGRNGSVVSTPQAAQTAS